MLFKSKSIALLYEFQTALTEDTNNADNNTVHKNNEEWRKGTTLIFGDSTLSGLSEKKMSRNRKIKVRYFPGAEIKDMYHYAIPLLEKKPENIILDLGTNDAHYKSVTNILKDLIELKDFILEKLPSCKKQHFRHLQSVLTKKAQSKTFKF